jgi:hypothetical protein
MKLHPYRPWHGPRGYSPASYREDPSSIPGVGFVVEKMVVEQTFVRVLRFSCVSLIPSLPHIHSSTTDVVIVLAADSVLHSTIYSTKPYSLTLLQTGTPGGCLQESPRWCFNIPFQGDNNQVHKRHEVSTKQTKIQLIHQVSNQHFVTVCTHNTHETLSHFRCLAHGQDRATSRVCRTLL